MRLKISTATLRRLEVINVRNGRRIGNFSACEIDSENGRILAVYAAPGGLLRQDREQVELPWESIVRIGADAILADREEEFPQENGETCLKM